MSPDPASASPAPRRHLLAALVIVVAGGALRFAWLNRGYTHFDEPVASAVVTHLHATRGFDTNWAHTPLGDRDGRAQYNFSSYYLTLAAWDRLCAALGASGPPPGDSPPVQVGGESPTPPTLPAPVAWRALSALLGTLVLVVAMRLAFAAGGWWPALGVGAWLALNPQLVQDSHYARPEAFCTLLGVVLVWLVYPNRRWSAVRGGAAGLLLGFLTASKITMLLWGWVPLLLILAPATPPAPGRPAARRSGLVARAGLVFAGMVAGFVLGVPRVLADWRGYWASLDFVRSSYGVAAGPFSHAGGGPVVDYLLRFYGDTLGWWMAALFAVGLVAAVTRRQWTQVLAVHAPVLVPAAFLGAQAVFFERNLSHLLPLFFLGAAGGAAALAQWMRGRADRWRPALVAACFGATLLLPATLTARLDWEGFSGRFARQSAAARAQVTARHPGVPSYAYEGPLRDAPRIMRWAWHDSGRPFLLFWTYSNELPTRDEYRTLTASMPVREVAFLPGLFSDLTTPSGLRNCFPCSTQVFLVTGAPPPVATGAAPERATPGERQTKPR